MSRHGDTPAISPRRNNQPIAGLAPLSWWAPPTTLAKKPLCYRPFSSSRLCLITNPFTAHKGWHCHGPGSDMPVGGIS